MFQRVSSVLRIELINQERNRIIQLLKTNTEKNKELNSYLEYLNIQLNYYPELKHNVSDNTTKLNKETNN